MMFQPTNVDCTDLQITCDASGKRGKGKSGKSKRGKRKRGKSQGGGIMVPACFLDNKENFQTKCVDSASIKSRKDEFVECGCCPVEDKPPNYCYDVGDIILDSKSGKKKKGKKGKSGKRKKNKKNKKRGKGKRGK